MSYTIKKYGYDSNEITSIENLNQHVIDYKIYVLLPIIRLRLDQSMAYLDSHFIPANLPTKDDDEDGTVTLEEVYQKTHALNKIHRKITYYENEIMKLKIGMKISPLLNHISQIKGEIKTQLLAWDGVKTSDVISDSKETVFTGLVGIMWYEYPLKHFLEHLVGKTITRVDDNKIWKITTMKELLRFVSEYYEGVEHITVAEYDTWTMTIPKNVLMALLQQLIIVDTHQYLKTDPLDMRHAKTERLNRAVHKIHSEFQISPKYIVDLFNEFNLLDCSANCIMNRSTKVLMKDPPEWIKKMLEKTK